MRGRVVVIGVLLTCVFSATASAHRSPRVERFVINQGNVPGYDALSVTAAPGGPIAPFPPGIQALTEPALVAAFVGDSKLRNDQGEVIGIGTEQQVIDFASLTTATTWTVTIPGRGTFFGEQQENLAGLFAI